MYIIYTIIYIIYQQTFLFLIGHKLLYTLYTLKRSGRPRVGGTTEQEDKYISVSSLRNRCLTSPQLAASLNSTHKNTSRREEAAPGCWPSRQSCKAKAISHWTKKEKIMMGKRTQTLDRGTLPSTRSRLFTVDGETGVLRILFNKAAS